MALIAPGVGANRNYRVGAVLFDKKGRVHARGYNSYKTHPALAPYSPYPYLHAESSCILHAGLDNCSSLSLLVTRIKRNNEITMAKPCKVCYNLLKEVGIYNIYYTDWKGNISGDHI